MRIKDLPTEERPYEKLENYGAEVLSNAELMAIIIRTGTKTETSVEVAQRILKEYSNDKGLTFLHEISLDELKKINGIGRVKAIQLKAVIELGKRMASFRNENRVRISSPADVSRYVMEEMRYLKQEHFKVIMLNVKNRVLKQVDVSIGTLNASLVHPRDVFSEPIRNKCASIILVHNHPSGDPSPSQEDIEVTKRIVESGKILGIDVLDHIIIGDGKYISLKEKGYM
ncbi:MAG: repair protein RadC [Petroclostridium sp.]|jgi:DNA repair protein RadC|uniref:RadC family protein n=1 Tax=Petroclostridium xylanilyticum TaxID=1792311 RepID=UPI001FA83D54|nr:DNA repair protein RadC [Petroclostridium xylanilyticum]MBZ4645006.1 replication and repair protein RadC [Clostridia bacterium]MDK2810067.1 repair protein RadC [Petroclostridium sp.]